MLRLKRVELQGFKSFCDRSEMRFPGSGIAAVVGPNGCGKSNLSDAISWVLGEQSAKSLRGSRMEDVIFAGTRDRRPVGMASVTMTMVDPRAHDELPDLQPDQPPAKQEEITITRRLYRSGESEYLINGRAARLRDIQDIFMGSGLGPESYAIIEQGRIGQILSTKPQDRRLVIEEAAGITRFKTKKRLAESKLESARANLSRVFDILEEVGRQVNSLKRQASKTKRYSELKAEMVQQLQIALSGRFRLLERDAAKTALDLNVATSDYQTLLAEVAQRETLYAALQESSYATEQQLTTARKELAEHRVEAERVRGRLEAQSREVEGIATRLTRGETETADLEKRFTQHQLELSSYTGRLADMDEQSEQTRKALLTKAEERDRLQSALRERERTIEGSRQQVLRLLGEASTLRNQLAQTDQYLLGLKRDAERLGRDEATAVSDLARLEASKADLSTRLSARQLELKSTTDQRLSVEKYLNERRSQTGDLRRQLEELRNETSRLKARRDSLEDVLSHRSYTTQSIKQLFTAVERGQAPGLKPLGVLADFVEVDTGYEKPAEEFLHEELEHVVVTDWQQAELGITFMRSGMDGRATFLVAPASDAPQPSPGEASLTSEPGVVAKLSHVLRFTQSLSSAPTALLPRVDRCYIVEDQGAAQRLAPLHPDNYFLLTDGLCYHGYAVSGGKKTGSGPLALKRELREVSGRFAAKQSDLDGAKQNLESLEREMSQLAEELERTRTLQQRQEKDALALDHENRKVGEEFSRAGSRLSVARLELQRLDADGAKARERRELSEKQVAENDQARTAQEEALNEARSALQSLGQDTARISEEHSALRVELAAIDERRRSETSARNRLENQVREIAQRRQQLGAELERLGNEKSRLLTDNAGLSERSATLSELIVSSENVVAELSAREAKGRADLNAADEQLKHQRIAGQAASSKRASIELDLVRKQAELKYLEETCQKELNCSLQELGSQDDPLPDEVALVEAEDKYKDLRGKIDALGPVNAQAVEELDEAQQRYDFLNAQRQDLLVSIRDTEKAIHEIDVESRKRFLESFEAINTNFREMFKTLFSGGVGEMRLADEENANESGIDIVASPPGKKLQSVLLLSGGERALTAMALLMAIFRYQPSPFCVLDEVDAPLDEANIERLTRLIKEMSVQTQFIVITHAKRTMESAQALYGVTMQEPGVSKLVSVRFNQPALAAPPQMVQAELTAV